MNEVKFNKSTLMKRSLSMHPKYQGNRTKSFSVSSTMNPFFEFNTPKITKERIKPCIFKENINFTETSQPDNTDLISQKKRNSWINVMSTIKSSSSIDESPLSENKTIIKLDDSRYNNTSTDHHNDDLKTRSKEDSDNLELIRSSSSYNLYSLNERNNEEYKLIKKNFKHLNFNTFLT